MFGDDAVRSLRRAIARDFVRSVRFNDRASDEFHPLSIVVNSVARNSDRCPRDVGINSIGVECDRGIFHADDCRGSGRQNSIAGVRDKRGSLDHHKVAARANFHAVNDVLDSDIIQGGCGYSGSSGDFDSTASARRDVDVSDEQPAAVGERGFNAIACDIADLHVFNHQLIPGQEANAVQPSACSDNGKVLEDDFVSCGGIDDDPLVPAERTPAICPSPLIVMDLVMVTVPNPPGSNTLISPPAAVLEIAPAKVLHGAVRLHGFASSPTPDTQVRVACACACELHAVTTIKSANRLLTNFNLFINESPFF